MYSQARRPLSLLGIPLELRLAIYEEFLEDHLLITQSGKHPGVQPSNAHIIFLHTCRQIAIEAGPILRRYVSFKCSRHWDNFCSNVTDAEAQYIHHADVANDGRTFRDLARIRWSGVEAIDNTRGAARSVPVSGLHYALAALRSLKRLRVFDDQHPQPGAASAQARYALDFEGAMFPRALPDLEVYELYVDPTTRATVADKVRTHKLQRLRLSGQCLFKTLHVYPCLRHLVLHTLPPISFLDTRRLDDVFRGMDLESFYYAQAHRLGFEMMDHHLESLVSGAHPRLKKLVLLSCSKLSTAAIASCVSKMKRLEYFALSLFTVTELRVNFIEAVPPSVSVFKLQVLPGLWSIPFFHEEELMADTLESMLLLRQPPPRAVSLWLRDELVMANDRLKRWSAIADAGNYTLSTDHWEDAELGRG
ncbi:hypothetical protein PLICRDRAFT_55215 [Plicaturopsis crispa FD-325 SS-3]|nr:hypothetical protein PLICRDRAFT_55215 [Plicaturopsis crispa FD-325 SS-3]